MDQTPAGPTTPSYSFTPTKSLMQESMNNIKELKQIMLKDKAMPVASPQKHVAYQESPVKVSVSFGSGPWLIVDKVNFAYPK